MTKLPSIAFLLALPLASGCPSDDNETNDDGADDSSSGTVSTTAPTTTEPTSGPTTTASTTTTTAESGSESLDSSGSETTPVGCVSADDPAATRTPLPAEITEATTLTCDQVWVLTEATFVRGATLTIEAGTNIVGGNGSALIIDVDASIDAVGSEGAPIVMTSAQPVGSRARADWGGLVLLGNGLVNLPNGTGQAEGFATPPTYGGTDAAHNCGALEYLRVEWAGFQLVKGSELNGITFYACGTATTANYVQSHMGSDDAFEWFGGQMDARYLVATGQADDAFDIDQGFTGTLQYGLVHQDPSEAAGNHGFEISNQEDDFVATPLTHPVIANVTMVGQGAGGDATKSIGFNLKEGTEAEIYSSYFTNLPGAGATIQDEETVTSAMGGGIVIEGNLWGDVGAIGIQGDPISWDAADFAAFITGQAGNMTDIDLALDGTWTAPNVKPAAGTPADGGGMTPGDVGLDATTFVGAVDPAAADDWTQAGWINYSVG